MLRTLRPLCLFILATILGLGQAPETASARTGVPTTALARRLAAKLDKAGVTTGRRGVVVAERGTDGRLVVRLGGSNSLIPASVAKVLTAAAALDWLGPGHTFDTRVSARGEIRDGVLIGDLVVHGSGDPSIGASSRSGPPTAVLEQLVKAVQQAGIRRVRGNLVLDDGALDREFVHASWSKSDRASAYGAGIGGLTLSEGCVVVQAKGAARAGGTPRVSFPATSGAYVARSEVKTVGGIKHGGLSALFATKERSLRIKGRVPVGKPAGLRAPVPDPVQFFGGAFSKVLGRAGIRVEGQLVIALRAADRRPGRIIGVHRTPLRDVLDPMNRDSRNVMAGTVFKVCGARALGLGSWRNGTEAIHRMAVNRRLDPGPTRILDGSGLSLDNRISADLLCDVLRAFDTDPLRGPALLASLPTSGKTGTLRRRMASRRLKGRVHAKTGTLNDKRVRSLAGYIDGKGGKPGYVFAIVLNGRGASHGLIDQLVEELGR